MNYSELTDKGIRKMTTIEQTEEFKPPVAPVEPFKHNLDDLLDQEVDGKVNLHGFTPTLNQIEKFEEKIRKVKLSGLSPNERMNFTDSLKAELVKSVEQRKAKRIKELLAELDLHEKKKDTRAHSEKLYSLEMEKLKFNVLSPDEKMMKMNRIKNDKYSEAEVLILSQDPNLKNQCMKYYNEVPPNMSNPEARKALKELELLTSLKTGEIPVQYEGQKIPDTHHVTAFINAEKLNPTINDSEFAGMTIG